MERTLKVPSKLTLDLQCRVVVFLLLAAMIAPPPVHPPGARFGPPDVPGFEPNRFERDPRRPGGGTHPDLEHFGDDDFI